MIQRKDGKVEIRVQRMVACKFHNDLRVKMIQKYGLRAGWEDFGQWSLKKAQEMARKEEQRINDNVESDDESKEASTSESDNEESTSVTYANVCLNGECIWRVKSAYDDVEEQLKGAS